MAKQQEAEEEEERLNELEEDEEEDEDEEEEQTQPEIQYHDYSPEKTKVSIENPPRSIPARPVSNDEKPSASVVLHRTPIKPDDSFFQWDDFGDEPSTNQNQNQEQKETIIEETPIKPSDSPSVDHPDSSLLARVPSQDPADPSAVISSDPSSIPSIEQHPEMEPGKTSTPLPQTAHPIFGRISSSRKDGSSSSQSMGSPARQTLPAPSEQLATPIPAPPAPLPVPLPVQPPLAPPQREAVGESGRKAKKKKEKKKRKVKRKKGLNFFGLAPADDEDAEEEQSHAPQASAAPGDDQVAHSEHPAASSGVVVAGAGGFGLSSLWDDGGYQDDGLLVPLPTPSADPAASDLEAGSDQQQQQGGGEGVLGSLLTSFSSGSAQQRSITISEDFLQNPFKKTLNSFFDNIETEIDLEDDPILRQVEWNKQNPRAARAAAMQGARSTADYIASLLPFPSPLAAAAPAASSSSSGSSSLPTHLDPTSSSSPPLSLSGLQGELREMRESVVAGQYLTAIVSLLRLLWLLVISVLLGLVWLLRGAAGLLCPNTLAEVRNSCSPPLLPLPHLID